MPLLESLQTQTGLGRQELLSLIGGAPRRYKAFLIPKRSGGHRMIAQPSRELKVLQRLVLETTLAKLPIHDAAAAYRPGHNIKMNAEAHAASRVILKLDFSDFFPSIRVGDWLRYCRMLEPEMAALIGLSTPEDMAVSSRILFWGRGASEPKCLSIGAPTSPILSNILMAKFDEAVSAEAAAHNVGYTRYADDITFSALRSAPLHSVESFVQRYIKRHRSPALTLNDDKRGLYTSGQKRMVTGLVVTPNHSVSLGRDRKRLILSLVHKYGLGRLDAEATAKIQGYVAFAKDVEPTFHQSLERKYGTEVLERLAKFRLPRQVFPPKRRRAY